MTVTTATSRKPLELGLYHPQTPSWKTEGCLAGCWPTPRTPGWEATQTGVPQVLACHVILPLSAMLHAGHNGNVQKLEPKIQVFKKGRERRERMAPGPCPESLISRTSWFTSARGRMTGGPPFFFFPGSLSMAEVQTFLLPWGGLWTLVRTVF